MRTRHKLLAAAVAFTLGFGSALLKGAPPERFDHKVRNDFFAGFSGDSKAFERAMKVAGETIAANPAEMDKAVQIAPDSVGVRIPRGAALLAATSFPRMDDRVRSEVQRAADDYQHTYDLCPALGTPTRALAKAIKRKTAVDGTKPSIRRR